MKNLDSNFKTSEKKRENYLESDKRDMEVVVARKRVYI